MPVQRRNELTKVAFIDLDGVVACPDARFQRAEEARNAFIKRHQETQFSSYSEKEATNIYWCTVFTPELVSLDRPIDDVNGLLLDLENAGYQLLYLTSRPEAMREATLRWLVAFTVFDSNDKLIMKAPAFQYVKTVVWKAGMIQTLQEMYGATDVLIVDDEQANIDEHLKYFSAVQTRLLCKSLVEAVAKLNGTWVEPEPFMPEE